MKKILITSLFIGSFLSTSLLAVTCPTIDQTYLDEKTEICVIPESWSLEKNSTCLTKSRLAWSWFFEAVYKVTEHRMTCIYHGFGGEFTLEREQYMEPSEKDTSWFRTKDCALGSNVCLERMTCLLNINKCVFP
jgi:hypothetical protein